MSNLGNKSVAELYRLYFRQIRDQLYKKTGCKETAADLAQDTFVRVLRSKDGNISDPIGYLYRTALNLSVDELRSNQRRHRKLALAVPIEDAPGEVGLEQQLHQRRRLEVLRIAIDELPPKCRAVFVMHRFEGKSYGEIARLMSISNNMVEKHIVKALRHCRDRLASLDADS